MPSLLQAAKVTKSQSGFVKRLKISVLSRRDFELFTPTEPSVAICIAYPTGRLHKPSEKFLDVLHVRFSDCDGGGDWSFPENKDTFVNKPIPMSRGQAVDILDFVEKWKDTAGLYIACYGGISRSAGVAVGLCAVFGWDGSYFYKMRLPNIYCKNLIVREARHYN